MVDLPSVKPVRASTARDATPVDHRIGQLIRQRREQLALRQDDFARLINVTARQVQKYEQGSNRISASRLVVCARALKVPVAWFFENLSPDGTSGSIEAVSHQVGELDLNERYSRLPLDVREKLLVIAELLIEKNDPTNTDQMG